jgi:exonuclease SbcC
VKWALFNEPRGMDFIMQGAKMAKVSLEISNGYKVTRERSISKNRYTLVRPDETTSVYEGFGNDVPEEITKAHGISKVVIDTDSDVSLNLGEQLEGPFLIAQTGAVRAKAIGRLTGVHVIDKAIRDSISDIKKESQTESRCLKEIVEIEDKLKLYEQLEILDKMINRRENCVLEVELLLERFNKLLKQRNMLEEVNIDINKAKCIVATLTKVKDAELNIYKLSEKKISWERLNKLRINFNFVCSELKMQEEVIENTRSIDLSSKKVSELERSIELMKKLKVLSGNITCNEKNIKNSKMEIEQLSKIQPTEDNINKLYDIIKLKNKLENLNKNYSEIKKSIQEGNAYINKVSDETEKYLQSYENELKKISKCPVCFGSIDEDTVSKIISQYKKEEK